MIAAKTTPANSRVPFEHILEAAIASLGKEAEGVAYDLQKSSLEFGSNIMTIDIFGDLPHEDASETGENFRQRNRDFFLHLGSALVRQFHQYPMPHPVTIRHHAEPVCGRLVGSYRLIPSREATADAA
jgi:hypothetical protein